VDHDLRRLNVVADVFLRVVVVLCGNGPRQVQSEMLEYERRSVFLNQIKVENARAALFGLETHLQEVLEKIR
jgi:hypothetical protein